MRNSSELTVYNSNSHQLIDHWNTRHKISVFESDSVANKHFGQDCKLHQMFRCISMKSHGTLLLQHVQQVSARMLKFTEQAGGKHSTSDDMVCKKTVNVSVYARTHHSAIFIQISTGLKSK